MPPGLINNGRVRGSRVVRGRRCAAAGRGTPATGKEPPEERASDQRCLEMRPWLSESDPVTELRVIASTDPSTVNAGGSYARVGVAAV